MLKGDECDIIVQNHTVLIDAIRPNAIEKQLLVKAWSKWEKVLKYLETTTISSKSYNFYELEDILGRWVICMKQAFNMKNSMPHYVHIIWMHLPDLLKIYGSLLPFSNQGFENSHGEFPQYCLRRLVMTIDLPDTKWGKIYLNEELQAKRQSTKQIENRMEMAFDHELDQLANLCYQSVVDNRSREK